ncbi:hypothetical protein H0H81_008524 [Sphagnurus paluster]|uniref:Uncharacterized protein n=1 Tax=Sphagnurus paluster TaxID=117069 RepID=A0A9P7FW04_9AGAR|nr:hypothetical protein H0H81_008524 [Sphagnurus paluster]
MFATYLTNLVMWIAAPPNFLEIPTGFCLAMSCVMGNRLILNLKTVNKERTGRLWGMPHSHVSRNGSQSVALVQPRKDSLCEVEMGRLRSIGVGIATSNRG